MCMRLLRVPVELLVVAEVNEAPKDSDMYSTLTSTVLLLKGTGTAMLGRMEPGNHMTSFWHGCQVR